LIDQGKLHSSASMCDTSASLSIPPVFLRLTAVAAAWSENAHSYAPLGWLKCSTQCLQTSNSLFTVFRDAPTSARPWRCLPGCPPGFSACATRRIVHLGSTPRSCLQVPDPRALPRLGRGNLRCLRLRPEPNLTWEIQPPVQALPTTRHLIASPHAGGPAAWAGGGGKAGQAATVPHSPEREPLVDFGRGFANAQPCGRGTNASLGLGFASGRTFEP